MKIEVVLENISNHEIKYSFESRDHRYRRQGIVFLDVRDGNGNLAPETEDGCRSHFFSTCHTQVYLSPHGDRPRSFAPREKIVSSEPLSVEYNLDPGEYTVVGYVCGMSEGPECFKTNTIKITVQ